MSKSMTAATVNSPSLADETLTPSGFLDFQCLRKLAALASLITQDCYCSQKNLQGWSAWPLGYHEEDFERLGTLARYACEESTLEEHHPEDTNYWSSSAPIAPRFYPYNQSTVWRCRTCKRIYLRHNDDGAYHVSPRIRQLHIDLIVDAAHSADGRCSTF